MHAPYRIAWRAGRSVVLLLVATLLPSMSLAQSTRDTASIGAPNDRMPTSLSLGTFEGRTVRVTLDSRTLVCRSPRFTPAGIALSPSAPGGPGSAPPALLPWKDVERIDVRGNSARTGAVIGAVAVGLLATAVGAAVASDPFLGKGSNAGGVLALTAAGTLSGAVLGALLGSSIPSWRNVCRRGVPTGAQGAGPATGSATPGDPTLFEVRQQCNEIAAFFPVDSAVARRWVPPAFDLAVDSLGDATGALIFLNCPDCFRLTTPDSPPLQEGRNTAPGSVVHLWFMLRGPAQVLPVPGAEVTTPTQYAYAVADLVTSPVAARVYRTAGKHVVLIDGATLVDEGDRQSGTILFANGSKVTFDAHTRTQPRPPLRLGGNVWTWHASDPMGNPGDVNTTRVVFLATAPGAPGATRVTIHAEPGTPFADWYGTGDVVASRATFYRPNNVANNSSRGGLAWTAYPPDTLPCPPALP